MSSYQCPVVLLYTFPKEDWLKVRNELLMRRLTIYKWVQRAIIEKARRDFPHLKLEQDEQ
jgi:hypothetical protein